MIEDSIRLKEAIKKLSEAEAKSMLFFSLLNGKSSEDIQQVILQMSEEKNNTNAQTVHILFGESPGGSLKAAFRNTDYQKTEDIIVLPHNLSIGPINDLHKTSGIEARFAWFKNRYTTEDDGIAHYRQLMLAAVEKINNILPHQNIVIWTCQNAHEQTGLRLVLAMLDGKLNTVRVIDTYTAFQKKRINPHLAQDNYPRSTGELNGETLVNFYEQGIEPLNNVQRQQLCDEGKRLLLDDVHIIRTWACDKLLTSSNEKRDDDYIVECAKRMYQEDGKVEYKKAARLIGEVIGHMQEYTGDEWIEYRLRCLIKEGVFSYKGDLKAMRFYEVKLLDDFLTN